jgi:metallophosphoesterase (TIGR00282 family)
MRILMIGDVVGTIGRKAIQTWLPQLIRKYDPDAVVANGENAAVSGRGIRREDARELFAAGIHCITLGNHAWNQPELFDFIDGESAIVRPANFPEGTPGKGYAIIPTRAGNLTVINVLGRALMAPIDCPFRCVSEILSRVSSSSCVLVDFHAETTSEKQALAWYLDGKISALVGTHTHVQTADERILPGGTGYLTDVGMVGAYDGIIGMEKNAVIRKFLTQLPVRFNVASGRIQFNAVLIDVDRKTKKASRMQRIRIDDDMPFIGGL